MKQNNSFDKYRVLIVDDFHPNIQLLSKVLSKYEIRVRFATSGRQALKAIRSRHPDLILLDIAMPELDGFQVCEIVKSNPKTKHIPIIFLTARVQPEDIVHGLQLGAVDYITKPFNQTELVTRVFTHLELKRSRDIIESQNNELKRLNSTKDKLFSIIAHDMKNPFHTLLGFSELLLENLYEYELEKTEQYLKLVYDASQQGFGLLENLLEWSRTQTGRLKYVPEKINLNELADECMDIFESNLNGKSIRFTNHISPKLQIFADRNMTTAILRNLFSNAIKFTPAHGTIVISVNSKTLTSQSKMVEIKVTDSGVGIAPENMDKLFADDVFFTTKGTNNEKGSGLGLLICKEFTEKHGGKIRVESKSGEGSSFIFTLPIKSSD